MSRGPAPARLAAYRILEEVERGTYADRAAAHHLPALDPRDRRLAMELAFGCLRLRARLDRELEALTDRPVARLDPPVRRWLRLGLYQLRELRVPDHAAVDEAVEGVRSTGAGRAAGLVNAVLRRAAREGRGCDVFPSLEEDPVGHLTTWGSHPEWLVRRWLGRWPAERVARLVERNNRPPPVTFRALGAEDVGVALAAARGAGLEVRPLPGWPRCGELVSGDPARLLEAAPAVIQDPAASAVVDYAGPDVRGPVLDACAAPGTKAVGLATLAPAARPYVAADVGADRLRRVRPAARRAGLELRLVAMDARRPAVAGAGTVLLDVPCTGSGVLRRRPDARWRIGPGRLSALVERQREILEASAGIVAPGGLLVYATCSLEPEENEEQVEAFLRRHGEFLREPPGAPAPPYPEDVATAGGDLFVRPWIHRTDGAYAARLRRAE